MPTLDDNVFKIKTNRGVSQRKNRKAEPAPNTVAVTRRNLPGNKAPLENRFSSPGANKSRVTTPKSKAYRNRRSKTPPVSWMSPVRDDQMPRPISEEGPTSLPYQSPSTILSPERRTRSYDCNLDQLKLEDVEPLTPTKKRNGIFGSFEKGLDQVRLMLTPGKKKKSENEPRKIKAVSNVSRISRKDPKAVLKNIHEVVQNMGVPTRVKGWVVRVQNRDHLGKIQLDFELEVCRLGGRALSLEACCGVRRKRIKGDAMLYKKMAEDILSKVLV